MDVILGESLMHVDDLIKFLVMESKLILIILGMTFKQEAYTEEFQKS